MPLGGVDRSILGICMTFAVLRAPDSTGNLCWQVYRDPLSVLTARTVGEVEGVLGEAEDCSLKGHYCVGYVAYEAALAFDACLVAHSPRPTLPLAQFGVFESREEVSELPAEFFATDWTQQEWRSEIGRHAYESAVEGLRALIAEGDTYQVNFTFQLGCKESLDPKHLFGKLVGCKATAFHAYLESADTVICSASPELFFELDRDDITCRPMKGTAPRGRTTTEDLEVAAELRESKKNRAENLMIVDMVRNDLGRIAEVGSVCVPRLFEVEQFASVHQMTSTVVAKTSASQLEIFRALFPAASVTGAPKVRTMEIIRDLEKSPRGVYTGCIGVLGPGRTARFSVAIRTAVFDRKEGAWNYGVGGGVVWDSTPEGEYEECLNKARVLSPPEPFQLIETLAWEPRAGFVRLKSHLARLKDSAKFFDFDYDESKLLGLLETMASGFPPEGQKIRILVDSKGSLSVENSKSEGWGEAPLSIQIALHPVDAKDRFLYHKTTRRSVYAAARAQFPEADEVVLHNDDGFVTEGTISNVAVLRDGILVTPSLNHGLLPGVLRGEMIATGELVEGAITVRELEEAKDVFLFNSARGIVRARLARRYSADEECYA